MATTPFLVLIIVVAVVLVLAVKWGPGDRRTPLKRLLTGLAIAPLVLIALYLVVVLMLLWGARQGHF
jgi:hypothetical protein